MTVGLDSYVTVEGADAYVDAYYAGKDVQKAWSEKDDAEKELLLLGACSDLDSLPFTGEKLRHGQPLMFPRRPLREVPTNIRFAQIEIALLPLNPDVGKAIEGSSKRLRRQQEGVRSFRLGDLSETYAGTTGALESEFPFLLSDRIMALVSRWLRGGYAIC